LVRPERISSPMTRRAAVTCSPPEEGWVLVLIAGLYALEESLDLAHPTASSARMRVGTTLI
jgi:hypothetical protein